MFSPVKSIIATLFVIFACSMQLFATHNRAGEITYCHISGLTYGITITTYTKTSSCQADRCELEIFYGDGQQDTISRINGVACSGCGQCNNCGEEIAPDIKKNIYYVEHTYSGAGTFLLHMEDPNRNENILNIPSSVNVTFYLESELIIIPGLGNNCSPILSNPPIDNGCTGSPYLHNPGAVDPDGDSLVYSLIASLGTEGTPIDGYVFPNDIPGCNNGTITINQQTGTLIWDSPSCAGQFNVAILIEEYRNGVKIGSVIRDMQIDIINLCPNDPPIITLETPQCLVAGDTLNSTIEVNDINLDDVVTLTASGLPLTIQNSPALFTETSGLSPVFSDIYWETNCAHVQPNSYIINFKAEDDNDTITLVDFEAMYIDVVAPSTEITTITAVGNTISLNWVEAPCNNANAYKIYRRIDSSGYIPTDCETGVPDIMEYTLIDNTQSYTDISYTDSDNLVHGQKYCYVVTSCYASGSESMVSNEICTQLKRDVPIITNVSIVETSITSGSDTIIWTNPTELDSSQTPAPYQYQVYKTTGFGSPSTLVYSSPTFNDFNTADTILFEQNIDTENEAHTYNIELLSNAASVGFSPSASSIYLNSTPTDNALVLNWQENVPWTNTQYIIYKENLAGIFDSIGITTSQTFTDTGLINGDQYCYYVKSLGSYSVDGIDSILYNNSQVHCNIPVDNVPPCAPQLISIDNNCEQYNLSITWNNPNNNCSDDVVAYYLFRQEKLNDPYLLFDSILISSDTSYSLPDSISIAGCYAISAIDTFYNQSPLSDSICTDNCPIYELPNVFSPGSDGMNDLFRPFPYRYVDNIRLNIYNRWGEGVFKTSDPDILWDGIHMESNKPCSEGVYYYTCDVFFITLNGIEKMKLNGHFQLLRENTIPQKN